MVKVIYETMLIMIFIILLPQTSHPCTTFGLDHGDQHLFGKNYDWQLERGLVVVNKRGVKKKALSLLDIISESYAGWTSKYGSLTFNQYGREIPTGGMNEAGLVIHLMNLNETQFPRQDSRPCIHALQWIQYQLDTHSSVEEVIASDSKIRVYPHTPRVHYLVKEKSGKCASIEFLFGKLVYHTGDVMPVKALANSTYAQSMSYLRQHQGFGGKKPVSNGYDSLDRFTSAAVMLKNYHSAKRERIIDYAFDILDRVAQPHTQWSIVYDQTNLRAYFHTATNPKIRFVDLAGFDLSCELPAKTLDLNADLSGNVTDSFDDYTRRINRRLIRDAYKGTNHLRTVSDKIIEERAKYPEKMTSCTAKNGGGEF